MCTSSLVGVQPGRLTAGCRESVYKSRLRCTPAARSAPSVDDGRRTGNTTFALSARFFCRPFPWPFPFLRLPGTWADVRCREPGSPLHAVVYSAMSFRRPLGGCGDALPGDPRLAALRRGLRSAAAPRLASRAKAHCALPRATIRRRSAAGKSRPQRLTRRAPVACAPGSVRIRSLSPRCHGGPLPDGRGSQAGGTNSGQCFVHPPSVQRMGHPRAWLVGRVAGRRAVIVGRLLTRAARWRGHASLALGAP
jgi:hypothetical protein